MESLPVGSARVSGDFAISHGWFRFLDIVQQNPFDFGSVVMHSVLSLTNALLYTHTVEHYVIAHESTPTSFPSFRHFLC